MAHKKVNLPEKICKTCLRSFSWRKKWEKNWEEVMYCSDKCRMNKNVKNQVQGQDQKSNI
ncbi:DUF2256 domain-containing protein [Flavobacterium helocola]|uniref:DUF2256 domain-containing protein n=1 Tax=Flavobacterium helocola TaxID=3139139 RepID=A0ABU9I4M4_9FLAO